MAAGSATFEFSGRCDVCENDVLFTSNHGWFRDHLLCSSCGSIPRERALMRVIKTFLPDYRQCRIHESSPVPRGVSARLGRETPSYEASQLFAHLEPGEIDPVTGSRCENLEALSLPDRSVDLFVTQDVFEHVFDAAAAFREIARVLKPGGAHIFTVPIVNKGRPTEKRADRTAEGAVVHLKEPQYHGNPVDPDGALVTWDWGYDIAAEILTACGLATIIVQIDDIAGGIRAEYIDVLVTLKPLAP